MPSSTTSSDPPRVLVVDDNEEMLSRTAAVLKRGCVVVGAVKDGREALKAADTLLPDVIVLDIGMAGMNGFEVAARLRDAGAASAIVFASTRDGSDFGRAIAESGARGFVAKGELSGTAVEALIG